MVTSIRRPNSGVIAHAGPYHLELVLADDAVQMWVLDKEERIVRPPADARVWVTVERPDMKLPAGYKTQPVSRTALGLSLSGDHFVARPDVGLRNPAKLVVRVELKMAGKTYQAEFVCNPLDFRHRLYDGR